MEGGGGNADLGLCLMLSAAGEQSLATSCYSRGTEIIYFQAQRHALVSVAHLFSFSPRFLTPRQAHFKELMALDLFFFSRFSLHPSLPPSRRSPHRSSPRGAGGV